MLAFCIFGDFRNKNLFFPASSNISECLSHGIKQLEYAEGTPWKAFSTIITDKNLVQLVQCETRTYPSGLCIGLLFRRSWAEILSGSATFLNLTALLNNIKDYWNVPEKAISLLSHKKRWLMFVLETNYWNRYLSKTLDKQCLLFLITFVNTWAT